MASSARRSTYADILSAPEHKVAELIEGVLHLSPRPAAPHARAASILGGELTGPFDRGRGGPGGWILLIEPELHFGDDVVVPDLAGWRRDRMPVIPHGTAYFTLAPDWICEVLSPSTRKLDRRDKLGLYARAGVGHAWLIDPLVHTLEVLRRHDDRWLIVGTWSDDARERLEPFAALELELAALWSDVAAAPDDAP